MAASCTNSVLSVDLALMEHSKESFRGWVVLVLWYLSKSLGQVCMCFPMTIQHSRLVDSKTEPAFLTVGTYICLWMLVGVSAFPKLPSYPWRCAKCTACWVASVVSDSVRPHRRQPTRLLCPWDSPGKNTGVGCHFLLQCMKVKSESEVAQSRWTRSDPMDRSPPGSSVRGIFQARAPEWGAIAFSEMHCLPFLNY